MPQLVWTADATGKLDYYNARLAAYGDGQSPAQGWAMRVRVHPDDLAATVEAWAKAMAGDGFYQHEHRLVMADGSARWHLSRARRVTSEDGPPKWFGTSTDIHDMKTTEQALATSIERLQIALDAGRMGTWDLNLTTREMVWNREMYRLLGHDPDTGVVPSYRTWAGRIHPADVERVSKLLNDSIEQGTDYHAEYRCLWEDGQLRWLEARGRSARDANGVPVRSYGVLMDITERKLADERQQLLMGELDHRVKNSLALVQAMAQQSFKGEDVPAAARRAFTDRLGAMAAAHSTLTRTRWEGAALADVIAEAIAFCGPAVAHIATSGPAVMLAADKTVPIAMAIHELCTNALKYGALSTESGQVSIGWSIDAASWLTIEWREQGGPPVKSPTRRGFGSLMIERAISHQLHGDSRLLYEPDGVRCTIRMPLQDKAGQ
jgi:PAS domain S-box-containing protein